MYIDAAAGLPLYPPCVITAQQNHQKQQQQWASVYIDALSPILAPSQHKEESIRMTIMASGKT